MAAAGQVARVADTFEHRDMSGSIFRDVNLHRAAFDDVNLSEATIRGAYLANLSIDQADITGMTISGVRIDLLVEAELDRRDPDRARLRMADPYDPNCVRSVFGHLEQVRASLGTLLRSVPLESLMDRPAPDRWSAIENLRHMVFVEELYTNRWLLRNDTPWSRFGLVADHLAGNSEYADVGSEPTEDVETLLTAWEAIHAHTLDYVARLTPEELSRDTSSAGSRQGTVGRDLQVLVEHTLSHIRQAEAAIGVHRRGATLPSDPPLVVE